MRPSRLFLQCNLRKVLQYRVRSDGENSRHCLQVPTCRLQGTHRLAGSVQIVLRPEMIRRPGLARVHSSALKIFTKTDVFGLKRQGRVHVASVRTQFLNARFEAGRPYTVCMVQTRRSGPIKHGSYAWYLCQRRGREGWRARARNRSDDSEAILSCC